MKYCKSGRHLWIDENIKHCKNGKRCCRLCQNLSFKKWNKDLPKLNSYVKLSKKENASFYWRLLVLQEIGMYIGLAKQVTKEDFNWLCNRRGFDIYMRYYLKTMIIFVGLGKELKRS